MCGSDRKEYAGWGNGLYNREGRVKCVPQECVMSRKNLLGVVVYHFLLRWLRGAWCVGAEESREASLF